MARRKVPERRLTLKLSGEQIPSGRFLKAVQSFFSIIESVSNEMVAERKSVRWVVSVEPGSVILHADAFANAPKVNVERLVTGIHSGVRVIEGRAQRPKGFNDSALRAVRELAGVADGKVVTSATVTMKGRAVKIEKDTQDHVDRVMGVRTSDYGSVEGRLEVVSVRGGPHISVLDIAGRSIACYVSDEDLDRALGAFNKRVEVTGLIRTNRNGEPVSIDVQNLFVFPDEKDLPDPDALYGILDIRP